MKKQTLWTKSFTLLTLASILGAAGGIAGGYALSFLVYDETGSTLAAGLLIALQVIPQFLLPLLAAPWMDRLPRKRFLVAGDLIGGLLYLLAGLYLHFNEFSYSGYLLFSLIIASIGAMDSLAYNSIYPSVIPEGCEAKGYSIAGMLYPVMTVLVMPLAAILLDTIGVAKILMIQGCLAASAGFLESGIQVKNTGNMAEKSYGMHQWWKDFLDGFRYLKGERGLLSIFSYMAVANGAAMGMGPILVAFFRSAPGFTAVMYSFFTAAEFIGRSAGSFLQYHIEIPKKKRFGVIFLVYQIYDWMDAILLWLPYPWMLVNRAICGFLGINSATLRSVAVQSYIPEEYRARVNAFQDAMISAAGSILALAVGGLGEILDPRIAVSLTGILCLIASWGLIWRNKADIRMVYE